jgi:hypothetical protein
METEMKALGGIKVHGPGLWTQTTRDVFQSCSTKSLDLVWNAPVTYESWYYQYNGEVFFVRNKKYI